MGGKFILSLDFELFWGLAGWPTNALLNYKPRIEGAVNALYLILSKFKEYDMKCTVGYVGAINFNCIEDFLRNSPSLKPTYSNHLLSSYGLLCSLAKDGIIDNKLLFRPDVIHDLMGNERVELSSHTFSHYYALEQGQNIGQFDSDLRSAISDATQQNISMKTIIFPRNQIPQQYYDSCVRNGFTHIRGNEESFLYKSETTPLFYDYRRLLRFMDSYINLTGHHTYKSPVRGKLIDVKASRFLRPYSPSFPFLEKLKIKRIKQDLVYAAKNNEVYHLWWHPHNFGIHTDTSIMQLNEICSCFDKLRSLYGMNTYFIKEL